MYRTNSANRQFVKILRYYLLSSTNDLLILVIVRFNELSHLHDWRRPGYCRYLRIGCQLRLWGSVWPAIKPIADEGEEEMGL